MFEALALLSLLTGLIMLCMLSAIDMKQWLLPNEYVMGLAIAGAVFHVSTGFYFLTLEDMALGGFIGMAFLYIVREVANRFYKKDALGLGDVKLLGAGGIWLGPYYILMAITAGALAGLVHGVILAMKNKTSLNQLALPAGPGFAVGLVIVAIIQLHGIQKVLMP